MSLPARSSTATLTARAVLFDMDGTLVDSTSIVEQVWTTFAGRYGLDIGEILRSSHGVQAMDTVRRFAPAGSDIQALAAELGRMELAETRGHCSGARRAGAAGEPAAGCRSARDERLRDLADVRMAAAGIRVPAVSVTSEDVSQGKPHPEGYLRAASLLGVAPADAVVFEDAPAGIAAGIAAGIRTVAVGPNTGELPDGVFHIPDYSGVCVTTHVTGAGLRALSFTF